MSWDAAFDEPVELPNGKTARTLRNAGEYIARLPKAEHEQKAWQTAMHCLIEAAEKRGPISFARMTFWLQRRPRDLVYVCEMTDCRTSLRWSS